MQVLKIEPSNIKALYRRAQASIGLEVWEAARDDLQQVCRFEGSFTKKREDDGRKI